MKDLSIIDDTKITKADKDGAAVIIDVDNYVNEANWQLNNKEFYKEIPNDLTQSNRKKVNHPIKELKSARILDEKNDNQSWKFKLYVSKKTQTRKTRKTSDEFR